MVNNRFIKLQSTIVWTSRYFLELSVYNFGSRSSSVLINIKIFT